MSENTTPYANSVFEQPWWLDIVVPGLWDEVTVERKGKGGCSASLCIRPRTY